MEFEDNFTFTFCASSHRTKENNVHCFLDWFCNRCDKQKLSHVSGNYCNSPSFSFELPFVRHVKIYFRVDWWSDLNIIEDVALCLVRRYFILNAEMGNFPFFIWPPLSGEPRLFSSDRLLLTDWNLLGNKGPQCAGKGSTWVVAMWMWVEGWGVLIVPRELLSQTQSPYEG